MKIQFALLIILLLLIIGCAGSGNHTPIEPSLSIDGVTNGHLTGYIADSGQFITWGIYDLEISRDGSSVNIIPSRTAMAAWGYHLNAVKLLEVSPCNDCLKLSNIYLLPNGDVSVDISITHPWPALPEENLIATGFDVRGIIMFPASQYFPDNDLREQAGLQPYTAYDGWLRRYSSHDKGDAELMNPDGWTTIWAPDSKFNSSDYQLEEGALIFEYYPGKFASGDNLGTINAFKRFYSNENRHMFEVGKTVTKTYIIRPPADGPIEASYAVYAHWDEPINIPVTDPAADFGPEANSPMPYEFWVTQDAIIDPDALDAENGPHIHWHVKTWDIDYTLWGSSVVDLLYEEAPGGGLDPHPGGEPDDYYMIDFGAWGYRQLNAEVPEALPGEWAYIFKLEILDPKKPWYWHQLGTDFYIAKITIDESEWHW